MKTLITAIIVLLANTAFAEQTIICSQVNKDGSLTKSGAKVRLDLVFHRGYAINDTKSKIQMRGLWKQNSEWGKEFSYIHANQSQANANRHYTIIFFDDAANGGMVEYQLQFNHRILRRSFSRAPADIVAGVDSWSSEPTPSWSLRLKCSSKYLSR